MSNDGNLSLMMMNESPYVVHLADQLARGAILDTDSIERSLPRRRFSLRESNRMRTAATDRRSKMISAPTNFNHVSRKLFFSNSRFKEKIIYFFRQTWDRESNRNLSIYRPQ